MVQTQAMGTDSGKAKRTGDARYCSAVRKDLKGNEEQFTFY